MQNELQQVERAKAVFGGTLTDDETALLRRIQLLFRNVIGTKRGFNMVIEVVATKLHHVVRAKLDPTVRTNVDIYLFEEAMAKDSPLFTQGDHPITENEGKFAEDVVSVIDFAIRNGIGFGLTANVLCHDVAEVLAHGSLDKALSLGFSPKTSGWASYDESCVGDPMEPEE